MIQSDRMIEPDLVPCESSLRVPCPRRQNAVSFQKELSEKESFRDKWDATMGFGTHMQLASAHADQAAASHQLNARHHFLNVLYALT